MKQMLMIGIGAVALVGISVGISSVLLKPAPVEPEIGAAVEEAPLEVFYQSLMPEFVVNFGPREKKQYLMVDVAVATTDSKVLAVLDTHMPEIRNDLLMLFSTIGAGEELYSEEGKLALREEARAVVSSVVEKHYEADRIDELFFTRFVMQ